MYVLRSPSGEFSENNRTPFGLLSAHNLHTEERYKSTSSSIFLGTIRQSANQNGNRWKKKHRNQAGDWFMFLPGKFKQTKACE